MENVSGNMNLMLHFSIFERNECSKELSISILIVSKRV